MSELVILKSIISNMLEHESKNRDDSGHKTNIYINININTYIKYFILSIIMCIIMSRY